MDEIPLFTVQELTAAFALILPRREAERWAREWFSRFADDKNVDSAGYYLYSEWPSDSSPTETLGSIVYSGTAEPNPRWAAELRTMSSDEKAELLLMGFSDLHLYLLVLVSPELAKRVQQVYGDTDEAAERRRREALRLVQTLRG